MPEKAVKKIVSLVCKIEPGQTVNHDQLIASIIKLMTAGGKEPGFWCGEIIPPSEADNEWTLLQRFAGSEHALSWKDSDERRELLEELSAGGSANEIRVSEYLSESDSNSHGTVATAIVTTVKPGMEKDYYLWESKIQKAQAKHPGYRGVYWQPPPPGLPYQWNTLLRFDTPENLQAWFDSDERRQLILEKEGLVDHTKFSILQSAYPGWVPIDEKTGNSPPKWKTALLVLLGLFPIVLLEQKFFSPYTKGLNHGLAVFTNLVGSVIFTTFVSMPAFIKFFRWWLLPQDDTSGTKASGGSSNSTNGKDSNDGIDSAKSKDSSSLTDLKGVFFLLCFFAIELMLLWKL